MIKLVKTTKAQYDAHLEYDVDLTADFSDITDEIAEAIKEYAGYDKTQRLTFKQGDVVIADLLVQQDEYADSPRRTICNMGQFVVRAGGWCHKNFKHPDKHACRCCTNHDMLVVEDLTAVLNELKYVYYVRTDMNTYATATTRLTDKDVDNDWDIVYVVDDPEGLDDAGVEKYIKDVVEEFEEWLRGEYYVIRRLDDEDSWMGASGSSLPHILDEYNYVENLTGDK
jgi:hypothetical protein